MWRQEGNLEDNCLYFDISKQERDSAIRYLLGVIVNTRNDSNFPSNYYTFDEDVNVYLAHLLFAIALPEYHEMAKPYLSTDSSQVLKWVRATEDRTIRYFIFKVNADHILTHTAIFHDLENQNGPRKLFNRPLKHFEELARLYYDQATAYHKRIYRKQTGVGDVLQKISSYYDSYAGLLKRVRKEYFSFVNGFRDQAFRHFVSHLNRFEADIHRRQSMDHFLDLYAQWLASKDPRLTADLLKAVREVRRWDPGFEFDIERKLRGDDGSSETRKCA